MRKLLTWAALLAALLTLAGCAGKEPPEPRWEDPIYRTVVYNPNMHRTKDTSGCTFTKVPRAGATIFE